MLIVAGKITIGEGQADKVADAAATMMTETMKEEGCHDYVFSIDVSDSTSVRIFERWESDEALAAHFQTPHMAEFNKALGAVDVKGLDVKIYDISGIRDLPGR